MISALLYNYYYSHLNREEIKNGSLQTDRRTEERPDGRKSGLTSGDG